MESPARHTRVSPPAHNYALVLCSHPPICAALIARATRVSWSFNDALQESPSGRDGTEQRFQCRPLPAEQVTLRVEARLCEHAILLRAGLKQKAVLAGHRGARLGIAACLIVGQRVEHAHHHAQALGA